MADTASLTRITGARAVPPLPLVSSGGRRIHSEQSVFSSGVSQMTAHQSTGASGAIWASAQQFLVQFGRPNITFASRLMLEITLQNTASAGNNARMLPLPFLFDHIDLNDESGANLTTLYPESLWYNFLQTQSNEKIASWAGTENFDATSFTSNQAGTDLVAGTTQTYYIPLPNPLDQVPVPLSDVAGFQFQFFPIASSPFTSNSPVGCTTANLLMSQARLIIMGERLPAEGKAAVRSQLAVPHTLTSICQDVHRFPTLGALSTGQTFDVALTTVRGRFSSLTFLLRPVSAVGEQRYQFNHTTPYTPSRFELTQINLIDDSGAPVWLSGMTDRLCRIANNAVYRDSVFDLTYRAYRFCFNAEDPDDATLEGALPALQIDQTWTFRATTVATAGLTCELVVLAERLSLLEIGTAQADGAHVGYVKV